MSRFTFICALGAGIVISTWVIPAQDAAPAFQLRLPEFREAPFDDGRATIELPERPIRRMDVLVLKAQEKGISPGSVKVWVNGKGIGNILEGSSVAEGTRYSMDAASLGRRPDEIFDNRENTVEVSATDRRGRNYYQNWIIRTVGKRNSMFTYMGTVSADDPTGVPPDIALDAPTEPAIIAPGRASIELVLKGTCSSAEAGSTFTVNGKPASTTALPATYRFDQKLTVARGTAEIALELVDKKGNRRRLTIPVVNQQATPSKVRFAGQKYALVIGVSRYGDGPDAPPPLYGAAADASAFASGLIAQGFKPENVRLITDDKATLPLVRVGFSDFVARATANDLLLVYVISYGMHDPRLGKSDSLYLATHGTRLTTLESTALSFEELDRQLNRSIRANNTFLVFDVGHELPAEWHFSGRNLINNRLLSFFSEQAGRAVLVSGSADEISRRGTSATESHLFNQLLLEGLAGKADLNLDKVVTAAEVFNFVTGEVQKDSAQAQNPRFRLSPTLAQTPVTQ